MDQRLTSIKLIDAWLNTGNAKLRLQGSKPPPINRQKAEIVVAHLLIYHYLKEDFHYTAYRYLLQSVFRILFFKKVH